MSIAKLLIINAMIYEKERKVEVFRYRFTYQTLCKVAGRVSISDRLVASLQETLPELGWQFWRVEHEFCIVRMDSRTQWFKLTSKRLDEQGFTEHASPGDIDAAFRKWYPGQPVQPVEVE
jgi:hypothetical protein